MASWIEARPSEAIRGFDLRDLRVDQAALNVTSLLDHRTWLYAISDACVHSCPYSLLTSLTSDQEEVIHLDTKHDWRFRVLGVNAGKFVSAENKSSVLCEVDENWSLGEFGVYDFLVQPSDNESGVRCVTSTVHPPVNIYLPLLLVTLVLFGCAIVHRLFNFVDQKIRKKLRSRKTDPGLDLGAISANKPAASPGSKKRLMSLDTFRGISIVIMMFVNDGAGGYDVLEHAIWDGLKLADLVFPWFLWIMGVCIPISIRSQLKKEVSRFAILRAVFKRSCILFLLGVMLNTLGVGGRLETIRVFGVLQRFGVMYLCVGGLCALLYPRHSYHNGAMMDVQILIPQWLVILVLQVIHLSIIFFLPVPGCPTGYLGPGGRSAQGEHQACIGGATGYIDRLILGTKHLYQHPETDRVYGSGPFDPEGPYGCLSSLLTVFLGVQAGSTLLAFSSWQARARRWATWAVGCSVLGAALSWGVPINKHLWSTSFALVTAGLAYIVLLACYLLIDVYKHWEGGPFLYPGMNATVMYVGHMVAYQLFPWHWQIGPMNTHLWQLIECVWGVIGWLLVARALFHKKMFLSI